MRDFHPIMITSHPQRVMLHHEVHARPYERMAAPLALTHLALHGADAAAARGHVERLLRERHLPLPSPEANHLSVDLGGVQLRFEAHTEFHTLTFWRRLDRPAAAFDATVLPDLPREWMQQAPGQLLVAMHLLVLPQPGDGDALPPLVSQSLDESTLVGARIMECNARVYTDFRLHGDGHGRWIVLDDAMNERRLGRAVQRLLEVETYRMMALLGLPAAREVGSRLATAERDLARLASEIREAPPEREPELLEHLTDLAAQIESLYASTHARFSASAAYFELVQRRIVELHEERLQGLQSLGEFMERRLGPAMQTCLWAARRQQALSERVARASNLLRTRVDIAQQQSSRALLDAMNRRGRAQLLLQSAVEGLSVAAMTYYGAGLVGYAAKGLKTLGWRVEPDVAVALSIPVIALAVWMGVRRLHRRVLENV